MRQTDHAREAAAPPPAAPGRERTAGREAPPAAWLAAVRDYAVANRIDIAIVASITLLAAALRFWNLGTVPLGIHGDEAWTGLDARRILDEGYIGPYVGSALGQPTGPLYFTALLFTFLPETTFTVRFSMALFSVATIPVAYLAFAQMFNRTTAAFAALILALMMWHLHLGRLGFMVSSWPFMQMAALALIWWAIRRRSVALFIAAGAATGLGVYTYNAYLLFVPVAFLPIAWMVLEQRAAPARMGALYMAVLFAIAALLFALPLLRFVNDNRDFYEGHQRAVGVQHFTEWRESDGVGEKAGILWRRAKEWNSALVYGDRPDYGDGLATQGHPPVHPLIYVFALVGLGVSLRNFRRPEYAVLIAAAVLLPWGALLTIHDGLLRRTFGLAPIVAVLAALPLAALWQALMARRATWGIGVLGIVLIVPLFAGLATVRQYFGPVQDSAPMKRVFPYQLDAASRYMADLPDGTYVYFYSSRWSINYETRRFVAPDVIGEDRSTEFRPRLQGAEQPAEGEEPPPVDLGVDRAGPVAFVLLDPYLDRLAELMRLHPGGDVTEHVRDGEVLFIAYHLPRGAAP